MKAAAATGDGAQVKLAIRQLVPEYQAQLVHSPRAALAEAVQKFSTPPMPVNSDQAGVPSSSKTANGVA